MHNDVINLVKSGENDNELPTMTASNRRTLWSFSSILMKSFFGGWGIRDRQDCRESSRDPK